MLFLLNDVVLDLAMAELSPAEAAHRYRRLDVHLVTTLGAEIFADHPRLQVTEPDRALALASMIVAVAPRINAALFISPEMGCEPDRVSVRLDRVRLGVLDQLLREQAAGKPIALSADREVWRRLAA